jgi:hypothetical protein
MGQVQKIKWVTIVGSIILVIVLVGILKKERLLSFFQPAKPAESKKRETSRTETVSEADYQMVIRGRLAEVQACYNEQLKKGLHKAGKLVVKWSVTPEGLAQDFVEELNELESAELYDCAITAISKWPFPKNQTFMIRYTFKMKELEKPAAQREVANTKNHGDDSVRDDVQDALGEL